MEKAVIENYEKYRERIELYKSFGYDIEKEKKFIIEKAYPLYGNILEVGTGKGYFTLALAKEGCNFTSIDISEEEQVFAKLNIKYHGFERRVNFKIENAEEMSFKDNSFDMVFCVNTFHHLSTPLKTADELIRVVSREGKIILSDFNQQGVSLVDKIHQSRGNKHHVSLFDLNYTARYLLDNGFLLEKYATTFQDLIIAYH